MRFLESEKESDPVRILIVEVDRRPESRQDLEISLKPLNYEISSAHTWTEVTRLLSTRSIDVVILEHGFASDDGRSRIDALKSIDPHIMVIVLTSQPEIENIIRIMRGDGAFDVLIKPLKTINVLHDSIQSALAQRQRSAPGRDCRMPPPVCISDQFPIS